VTAVLEARDVFKEYHPRGLLGRSRVVRAVNGVSLSLDAAETLGLVGESGCGKSTFARLAVGLERPTAGEVLHGGRALSEPGASRDRELRRRSQIVFQDPFGSLNPRMTIGDSVAEGLVIHRLVPRAGLKDRVAALLGEVGLAAGDADRYPHEFSGGQRQRIGIARALAVEPAFVACDEPVSALDVSVRAQIVNLLRRLQAERGLAYLFIAHDFAVVAQLAQRIAVMYLGFIVELGPAPALLRDPRHPYTRALISAVPTPDPAARLERIVLTGDPPSPTALPPGCPFVDRCYHPSRDERCRAERPVLRPVGAALAACHYAEIAPVPSSTRKP